MTEREKKTTRTMLEGNVETKRDYITVNDRKTQRNRLMENKCEKE
jgi:hypothetical protein